MNYTKKKKTLIYYMPLLALLLSLCAPAHFSKAFNWNSGEITRGTKLTKGDTITYNGKIIINYCDFNGKQFTTRGPLENKITIEPIDNANITYIKYTVGSVSILDNEKELEISLIGFPNLNKLEIDTPPSKTNYLEGEPFDSTGMEVTACYDDRSEPVSIEDCKISPSGALSANNTSVTISYTDKETNVTKTATQKITVKATTPNSYTISARAAAGGSISDPGGSSVSPGDSKTYTITPNSGHRINYVEVDGDIIGTVSSYTFYDVQKNHSISAYFLTDGTQNNAAKKKLTVIGSFAAASGAGSYLPGTKVTVNAGFVPGFTFAGWIASDGIVYPSPTMSYVMPDYDSLLYANWIQAGAPNALSPIITTNLKGQQLTSWADITSCLATFNVNDQDQADSPVMKVTASGLNCYIDAAPIAMLNTRQGIALEVSYGTDASFTFYSDADNSQFTGADFTYTCSTAANLFLHEKNLIFTQPGAINTGICLNVALPDAQAGQIVYVYHVNEKGTESMYLPAIVDAENKITIPVAEKFNISIKY